MFKYLLTTLFCILAFTVADAAMYSYNLSTINYQTGEIYTPFILREFQVGKIRGMESYAYGKEMLHFEWDELKSLPHHGNFSFGQIPLTDAAQQMFVHNPQFLYYYLKEKNVSGVFFDKWDRKETLEEDEELRVRFGARWAFRVISSDANLLDKNHLIREIVTLIYKHGVIYVLSFNYTGYSPEGDAGIIEAYDEIKATVSARMY